MKKRLLLAGLTLAFASQVMAQSFQKPPRCGFEMVEKHYLKIAPDYLSRRDAMFQQARTTAAGKPAAADTVYKIPVVFHIVYKTAAQNLHDSVILNQLDVLNAAYRRTHADTGLLRDLFKPLSADAHIEFYLAGTDPDGNPTTGITRTATSINTFFDIPSFLSGSFESLERAKSTLQGGIDPWPTSKYLNIWVVNMDVPGFGPVLLGYATPPMNPLPPNWPADGSLDGMKDGVVIQYQAFGNNNPAAGPLADFGMAGRTTVHEVGHYLGLRHIWGDADGTVDSCEIAGDDGIEDTPHQGNNSQSESADCPSDTKNTCGDGVAGDLPDLWENYMDYSRETCQSMFTHGQVDLMRSVLENQRDTLVSGVITPAPLAIMHMAAPDRHSLIVYPQPAGEKLTIAFTGHIDELHVSNAMGQTVVSYKNLQDRQIDVSQLPAGVYFLKLRDGAQAYSKTVLIQR